MTPYPSGDLGGLSIKKSCGHIKTEFDERLSLRHPQSIPSKRLCLSIPINSWWRLYHHLHQSGTVNGMGGITQVLLCILRNLDGPEHLVEVVPYLMYILWCLSAFYEDIIFFIVLYISHMILDYLSFIIMIISMQMLGKPMHVMFILHAFRI